MWVVGLGLLLAAFACGGTADPTGLGGAAGSAGVGGASGGVGGASGGVGGSQYSGDAGTTAIWDTTTCPADEIPFIKVTSDVARTDGPQPVRLVERGVGLPPEYGTLPAYVSSADELGWLRVADIEGQVDAGAPDAAVADAGDADARAAAPGHIILGPRRLSDVPAAIGDTLGLTIESSGQTLSHHSRIMLQKGTTLLLFSQEDNDTDEPRIEPFPGLTITRGNPRCNTPFPDAERACAKVYQIQQWVSLPQKGDVYVNPGETKTSGTYHVFNGRSTRVTRLTSPVSSSCADIGRGSNQITVLRSSFEE